MSYQPVGSCRPARGHQTLLHPGWTGERRAAAGRMHAAAAQVHRHSAGMCRACQEEAVYSDIAGCERIL